MEHRLTLKGCCQLLTLSGLEISPKMLWINIGETCVPLKREKELEFCLELPLWLLQGSSGWRIEFMKFHRRKIEASRVC